MLRTRRRGGWVRAVEVIICMITGDFSVVLIYVTGVSLSLSLSLLHTKVTQAQYRKRGITQAQYRKRFRASYNVGKLVFHLDKNVIGMELFLQRIASYAMTRIQTIFCFSVREPDTALSPLAIHFECVQISVFCYIFVFVDRSKANN